MSRSPTLSAPAFALAVVTFVASTAAAQDQQTVNVTGQAEEMCTLGLAAQGDGALVNFETPSGSVFAITQLSDPDTMTTRAANITLTMPAMCNGVHRVALASDNNGLWRQGVASNSTGFGSAVPYDANLVWADQQYRLDADATSRGYVEEQVLIGRPAMGEMLIEFQVRQGATNVGQGSPLLAGEYSDVLRVTVEPQ